MKLINETCRRAVVTLPLSLFFYFSTLGFLRPATAGTLPARLSTQSRESKRSDSHNLQLPGEPDSASIHPSSEGDRYHARLPAARLAEHFMAHHAPNRLKWDWGDAVFLYGLQKLATSPKSSPEESRTYWNYVRTTYRHFANSKPPVINQSDRCAPALGALALKRELNDESGMSLLPAVEHYLLHEPRNSLGSINHLGHAWTSYFFPKSIWVDSLVMLALTATQMGKITQNPALVDFGLAQPEIFARVLQDHRTGLFRHAWKTDSHRPIPTSATFWLRGNGWVLASIVDLLDELPEGDPRFPRLVRILERTAEGLLPYQLPSGLWRTLANLPRISYEETSGSALVAYALAKGVRKGYLNPSYLEPAHRAFQAVTAKLRPKKTGLSMTGISGPTNPGPRFLYQWVPLVSDAPYGVGAYLMAATELDP
jgi:unsaturated rhamnogalacturonyl hydrolase